VSILNYGETQLPKQRLSQKNDLIQLGELNERHDLSKCTASWVQVYRNRNSAPELVLFFCMASGLCIWASAASCHAIGECLTSAFSRRMAFLGSNSIGPIVLSRRGRCERRHRADHRGGRQASKCASVEARIKAAMKGHCGWLTKRDYRVLIEAKKCRPQRWWR
jgi:hypothetical protein